MYIIPRSNFIINILNQCFKLVDAGLNTVQLHIPSKYQPIIEPPKTLVSEYRLRTEIYRIFLSVPTHR